MIRVAQERRGKDDRLRQFARPRIASQFLRIENGRREISRPNHKPRERQDGVVRRRQRAADAFQSTSRFLSEISKSL